MAHTKITEGDRTIFDMEDAGGAETRRLMAEQTLAGADPDKTFFRTHIGEFTLRELTRYLYG